MQVFLGVGFDNCRIQERKGEKMSKKTPIYYRKDFSSVVEMLEELRTKVAEMKESLQNMWNVDFVETQVTRNEAYAILYLSQK